MGQNIYSQTWKKVLKSMMILNCPRHLHAPTSSNLITYCKVTKISPGLLELAGEGFTLKLKYDKSRVIPEIEFIPVKDITLRHYWPAGGNKNQVSVPRVKNLRELTA